MRKIVTTLYFALFASLASGQQVRPASSEKIYHELEQLQHLVNVLYVAAHPDDENTRLLAWLVNDQHLRTAYLSLTRGDGGQNILGSEQGDALGLIRTHELMEARKIDGAEQFFSRAIDFGFSKTNEETFKHWPQKELTGDAVWVMRKYRPDIVICRFPPDTMAGHGQHAASAIIAAKAFKATSDKTQFPEQLKYCEVWQPKRLIFNAYKFGSFSTVSEDMFKMPVGNYEPTLGYGTGEIAGISRSVHKSQGAGTANAPGVQNEYFRLVDGEAFSQSLFDGIDMTWGRVGRMDIGNDLKQIADHFDFRHPDLSLPALIAVRRKIETVSDLYWRNEKLAETDKAILDCTGLMAELYAKQPQATRGATVPFTLHIIARSHTPIAVGGIQWAYVDTSMFLPVSFDSLMTIEHNITIPMGTAITQPYWLSAPHAEKDMFAIPDETLLGLPETPNNLFATLQLKIDGMSFPVSVPLSYKKTDPIKGDVVEQLRIVPDATIEFNSTMLIAHADSSVDADVHIHTYKDLKDASLELSAGSSMAVATVSGLGLAAGADTIIAVHISKQALSACGTGDFYLSAKLQSGVVLYDRSMHLIQYNHLPALQYFSQPTVKVVRPSWKCTVKHIGYIAGPGDNVPQALKQAGLEVDMIKESELTSAARLKKYDAIMTGIRAVNVEKKMVYWLPVLFQYVQNGGTLVMQYNTTDELATTKLGPYPFTLARQMRVTEEDAKVTFLDPANRLLNYPNKITDKDFDDWVQERGLYFAGKWDDKYTPLFSMHDEGEQPLKGGTLYTKYGKGNYVYTCLSFSRQLPAGNAGAIRLMMNMLSIGK